MSGARRQPADRFLWLEVPLAAGTRRSSQCRGPVRRTRSGCSRTCRPRPRADWGRVASLAATSPGGRNSPWYNRSTPHTQTPAPSSRLTGSVGCPSASEQRLFAVRADDHARAAVVRCRTQQYRRATAPGRPSNRRWQRTRSARATSAGGSAGRGSPRIPCSSLRARTPNAAPRDLDPAVAGWRVRRRLPRPDTVAANRHRAAAALGSGCAASAGSTMPAVDVRIRGRLPVSDVVHPTRSVPAGVRRWKSSSTTGSGQPSFKYVLNQLYMAARLT